MKLWKLAGNISDGYKLIIRVKRLIPNCNGSRSNTPKSPPRRNSCTLCQSELLSPCPCSQSCMSLALDIFLQDNCFPFSPFSFSGRRVSFGYLKGKKKTKFHTTPLILYVQVGSSMGSPFLESASLKSHLHTILSNVVLLEQGGWTRRVPVVPANLTYSVI